MQTRCSSATVASLCLLLAAMSSAAAPDAIRGKEVFEQCSACHALDDTNGLGPSLSGVVGRKAGLLPGFRFSRAMRNSQITWSAATLDAYIADPQAVVPGNLMPYSGLPGATQRADLIAYLDSQGGSPAAKKPPAWAYPPLNMPVQPPAPPAETGALQHVPGSEVGYTFTRIYDVFNVPDWFPEDHPPMPDIVAFGRKPSIIGCGYCHLPNGLGKPEDASLAGLSADYIMRQMADFKSGARKSSDPARAAPIFMTAIAQNTTDEDAMAASRYFAALLLKPRIRVVETDTAPKVELAPAGMFFAARDGGTEPIGNRIVELPENQKLTELADSRSGFVAYVPLGAVQKGGELVQNRRADKVVACSSCHGVHLDGYVDVPPIAGRSPSYIFRQLYDFREGARAGPRAVEMSRAVAHLNDEELLEISAFLAARSPGGPSTGSPARPKASK